MFKGRSVIEIMVLFFTFIVGFSLLATGATIAIIEIRNPTADTDAANETLFTAITIVLGALLGLLAGKSSSMSELGKRPGETEPKDITERTD
jgi:UPF0716 family protein affecting phage T7 exclusion